MADVSTSQAAPDFLISGNDYLNREPGFRLVGRKDELNAALDVLNRKGPDNNLVLSGQLGTGVEAVVMGLQAADTDKSYFYLDVDALFALNNPVLIMDGFRKAMKRLKDARNPVLVIKNTKDFLNGITNNNVNGLINELMLERPHFQTVFVASDTATPALMSAHEDLQKNFIEQDILEPTKDDLRAIIEYQAAKISTNYGVTISPEAINSVLDLTSKYSIEDMPRQPERSLRILKGAITATLRTAKDTASTQLEEKMAAINAALEQGKPAEGDLADKSPSELAAIREITQHEIEAAANHQKELDRAKLEMDAAQEKIRTLKNGLDAQEEKDADAEKLHQAALAKFKAAAGDKPRQDALALEYARITHGQNLLAGTDEAALPGVADSETVRDLQAQLDKTQVIFSKFEGQYNNLLKADAGAEDEKQPVTLTEDNVLTEFSRLSRVPMTKLQDDEAKKLMNLESTLGERVLGQPEAISAVSKAVRRARNGIKDPKKTDGVFIFLGPPGVGKTELSKALSDALGYSLNFFDMSQYKEQHAISKLIGAPPGYVGYDSEGELTKKVRENPKSINLFDEAEKAHPDVFDALLHPFNDGVMADNKGNDVSFTDTLNILTTNLGSEYFLRDDLTPEEAAKKAMNALNLVDPETGEVRDKGFKPEFLSRVDGIFCFNKLGNGEIRLIAANTLKKIDGWVAAKGKDITIDMPKPDLDAMVDEQYDAKRGARSIVKYIEGTIGSEASDYMTMHPNEHGTLEINYTPTGKMTPDDLAQKKANVSAQFVEKNPAPLPAPQTVAKAKTAQPAAG
jgi:ATP-dependent Clp protease ATP-binding subunit ClpA